MCSRCNYTSTLSQHYLSSTYLIAQPQVFCHIPASTSEATGVGSPHYITAHVHHQVAVCLEDQNVQPVCACQCLANIHLKEHGKDVRKLCIGAKWQRLFQKWLMTPVMRIAWLLWHRVAHKWLEMGIGVDWMLSVSFWANHKIMWEVVYCMPYDLMKA